MNDLDLESCNKMYSATFRSEPFKLSSVDNWKEEVSLLTSDLALSLYLKDNNFSLPDKPNSDRDYDFDRYYERLSEIREIAEEWFYSNYQDLIVNADTLVVELCNYKGEGEGLALFISSNQYPVFISKRHSFFDAQ